MFLSRAATAPILRRSLLRSFSTTPPGSSVTSTTSDETDPSIDPDFIDERSPVELKLDKLANLQHESNRVFSVAKHDPVDNLPKNPEEISSLDPAHLYDPNAEGGHGRHVLIRQMPRNPSQSPETMEKSWVISFEDHGASANTWKNPLMGWVSGGDPMAANMGLQLVYRNAKEAVYHAKKRGWTYEVAMPIQRAMRSDGAQYQDNFLPQRIAAMIRDDGAKCDHWHRAKAGASHYTRPLKYHGDGLVPQYGPNPKADVAPHVEGKYKLR